LWHASRGGLHIREGLLQYTDQGSRRALYGARSLGRQGQFDRSLVMLRSAARDRPQRLEPPDQVARSRLVNGKRPRRFSNRLRRSG